MNKKSLIVEEASEPLHAQQLIHLLLPILLCMYAFAELGHKLRQVYLTISLPLHLMVYQKFMHVAVWLSFSYSLSPFW